MLKYLTLEGEVDKVQTAINRLKAFEPKEGYYLAFSGGKDSQCIYHLAKMAGVKFDAHYTITSVDPPELIRFIKKYYPDVSRDYPRDKDGKVITMWSLIASRQIPPTMKIRYCCDELKEGNGKGRITVTGVRWAESKRRKAKQGSAVIIGRTAWKIVDGKNLNYKINKNGSIVLNEDNDESRRIVENCYRTRKVLVNPIVDWEDDDVWEFLNDVAKVPHCELYDQGVKRIGCIGCPMSKTQCEELDQHPKYKESYLRAFSRMLKNRSSENDNKWSWKNPQDVFEWWVSKEGNPSEEEGLDI